MKKYPQSVLEINVWLPVSVFRADFGALEYQPVSLTKLKTEVVLQ